MSTVFTYFRPSRWFGATLAVAAALGMLACETSESPPIEGSVRIIDPGPRGGAVSRPTAAPVDWLARRILIPLDHPTEEVWQLTDETILPDASRAVWNGNGLRVGLLNVNQADEFGPTLGNVLEVQDTHIRNVGEPELLRRSPPLRAEFFADLTVPPLPVTKEYFSRGRLQLLMTSRPRGDGSALLTLLPQHYFPRSSFVPRTAAEKLLDGRIYDELGIDLNLGPREALLIGYYQTPPPEAPDDNAPADSDPPPADPDTTGAGSEIAPLRPSQPPTREQAAENQPPVEAESGPPAKEQATTEVELNLGRGLFTTGATDRDRQILILIRPLL